LHSTHQPSGQHDAAPAFGAEDFEAAGRLPASADVRLSKAARPSNAIHLLRME
jgi:hypothetical protein